MNEPAPPRVTIVYRNGIHIECPVKYLGWKIPQNLSVPHERHEHHCWRVINEGPFDCREGDQLRVQGGTLPQWVETVGTGSRNGEDIVREGISHDCPRI